MEENLLILLCIGLETKTARNVRTESFSGMSLKDWLRVRAMADKQGVSAIVFDGLNTLVEAYGKEKIAPKIPVSEWQKFVYNWIGVMTQVEHQNKQQMVVLEDMACRWKAKDCLVMVMKGQASGTMYPRPEHRSTGDIDCYLINDNDDEKGKGYIIGNDVAREAGAKVDESWYKHSVISYKGETFENHQYFVHTRDGKRGKRLNEELVEGLKVHDSWFTDERAKLTQCTYIPPVQWTAMFLTYHGCGHFISEGLRLKQLLDWTMLLKSHQNDIDWSAFYAFCERHHLRRFADAATAISVEYLGIKITNPAITTVSPYTERILKSALYDDDYVFGSGEGCWHNRWHLVRNLFHYRWKYEDIYETSPWKQLWYYASGYLFHTE